MQEDYVKKLAIALGIGYSESKIQKPKAIYIKLIKIVTVKILAVTIFNFLSKSVYFCQKLVYNIINKKSKEKTGKGLTN